MRDENRRGWGNNPPVPNLPRPPGGESAFPSPGNLSSSSEPPYMNDMNNMNNRRDERSYRRNNNVNDEGPLIEDLGDLDDVVDRANTIRRRPNRLQDIERDLNLNINDENSRGREIDLDDSRDMPSRTKLGRRTEAEQLIRERDEGRDRRRSGDNREDNSNNSVENDPEGDFEEDNNEIDNREVRRSSRDRDRGNNNRTEEETDRNNRTEGHQGTPTNPINFLQSIFLICLSGAILGTIGLWGWKALSNMDRDMTYEDITSNIGILNGNNIEAGDNRIWDMIQDNFTEKEITVETEVDYNYNKKNKSITFEYKEYELYLDVSDKNFKFKKKGKALVEIIEDNMGELLSYDILDVIK